MKKWQLFYSFFKIGAFTFGGGLAMLSLIKDEVVNKRQWITDDEMVDMVAISEATPGVLAVNTATYVGCRVNGLLGGIIATLGVILPSLIIICLISLIFDAFLANQYVGYAFQGIRVAVAIMILNVGFKLFAKTKKTTLAYLLVAGALIISFLTDISTIYIILSGGLISLVWHLLVTPKEEKVDDC